MQPEYRVLVYLSDMLGDAESARVAAENRLHSVATEGLINLLDLPILEVDLESLRQREAGIIKQLELATKTSPLGPLVQMQKGLGLKTIGRLLGFLGDPYWHPVHDRPRTVSELWAYSGLNPAAPEIRKGMTSEEFKARGVRNGIRKTLYVVTTCLVKQKDSPYRKLYDERKAETEGKTHTKRCVNTIKPRAGKPAGSNGCGTREHPEWGEEGSPWRDGHRHADAMRITAKAVLVDLYDFSKKLHLDGGHALDESQSVDATVISFGGGQGPKETHILDATPEQVEV